MMQIELNDFGHLDLSEIKPIQCKGQTVLQVPWHIYEDHFLDQPEEGVMTEFPATDYVYFRPPVTAERLREIRTANYHANVWWPELAPKGLTLPGRLIKIPESGPAPDDVFARIVTPSPLEEVLLSLEYPAYIRTHVASPKDVVKDPVFEDAFWAFEALTSSERTRHDLSWVLWKPPVPLALEARGFVYKGALTALCQSMPPGPLPSEEVDSLKEGAEWLRRVVPELPYWDCVVDIGLTPQGWKIIEINCFGADLIAGGTMFSWREDHSLLHGRLPFELRYESF